MADGTKIEWTDATVNAINGCTVVSPGCTNCYAMRLAGTRLRNHPSRAGLTQDTKAGPVWTGEVRLNEKALLEPLGWKRPRMIFWNAHGDLFHPAVPDEWIDREFAVMMLAPQHIHQVLTKRTDRMRVWMQLLEEAVKDWFIRANPDKLNDLFPHCAAAIAHPAGPREWPLPNVWIGTSVEDQARADERIPLLLQTPAAVRWLSMEPLLGSVDLTGISTMRFRGAELLNALTGELRGMFGDGCATRLPPIDWIVLGGESGPGARPMHPDWARPVRDQCAAAGVPFHFKQWGAFLDFDHLGERWNTMTDAQRCNQQFLEGKAMIRVGKKAAGRLLDGVEHNGMPALDIPISAPPLTTIGESNND